MDAQEVTEVMGAMAMAVIVRTAKEWWHKIDGCSCDRGYFLEGIPCEIGREEIAERRQVKFFNQWDAIGLGYVGPGRR